MKEQVTILGAGISGRGAALLAKSKGYEVFVSDFGAISEDTRRLFDETGIEYEENQHSEDRILTSNEIIKSPGISPRVPIVAKASEKGIPIIDELEFAGRYLEKPSILITGTNGKTTTTLLTAHLLNCCGIRASAVGNVGESLAGALLKDEADLYVVETSSYQLDGMSEFRTDVAMLLNITPDHLDRYGKMENYISSKLHIRDLLKNDGWFIYNGDDPNLSGLNDKSRTFSLVNETFAHLAGERLCVSDFEVEASRMSLKGDHNKMNALAAVSAALKFTDDFEGIIKGLETYQTAPHRLEWVESIKGVDFVNDSKATNVEAVKFALGSYDSPLVWIAGGVDKGNEYELIRQLVREKVHSLVCMGTDNEKLIEFFKEDVDRVADTRSMEEAIRNAWEFSRPHDVVLLSPACASFDLFKNYMDRGDQFREGVKRLKMDVEREAYEQS